MAKKKERMSVGGQAVLEGVMMRSKNYYSVAVRRSSGSITSKAWPLKKRPKKGSWKNWPVVRGIMTAGESMSLGFNALDYSGKLYEKDLEKEEKKKKGKKGKKEKKKLTKKQKENREKAELILTIIISIGLAALLFIALPWGITKFVGKKIEPAGTNRVLFNTFIVIFKLFIFFLYVWGISMIGEMKRFFQYHGAEHKSIYAYEAGERLIPANIKKYSTLHSRCGTAFIVLLLFISLFVFVIFLPPHYSLGKRLLIELALILPLAGFSYELLKFSDKYRENPAMRIFILPGLAFQKITTKEPDKGQMEVAAKALNKVLLLERKRKRKK